MKRHKYKICPTANYDLLALVSCGQLEVILGIDKEIPLEVLLWCPHKYCTSVSLSIRTHKGPPLKTGTHPGSTDLSFCSLENPSRVSFETESFVEPIAMTKGNIVEHVILVERLVISNQSWIANHIDYVLSTVVVKYVVGEVSDHSVDINSIPIWGPVFAKVTVDDKDFLVVSSIQQQRFKVLISAERRVSYNTFESSCGSRTSSPYV